MRSRRCWGNCSTGPSNLLCSQPGRERWRGLSAGGGNFGVCPSSTFPASLSAWRCGVIGSTKSVRRAEYVGLSPHLRARLKRGRTVERPGWKKTSVVLLGLQRPWPQLAQPQATALAKGAGLRLPCETFGSIKVHRFVSTEAHQCQDSISSLVLPGGGTPRCWCSHPSSSWSGGLWPFLISWGERLGQPTSAAGSGDTAICSQAGCLRVPVAAPNSAGRGLAVPWDWEGRGGIRAV